MVNAQVVLLLRLTLQATIGPRLLQLLTQHIRPRLEVTPSHGAQLNMQIGAAQSSCVWLARVAQW